MPFRGMKMNNVVKRIAILSGLAIALLVGSQYAMATAPEVNIAQGPLFSGRGNVHPNMLLNLSVEFPTVGAAYRGTNDYNKATEYLGYFNPKEALYVPGYYANRCADYHHLVVVVVHQQHFFIRRRHTNNFGQ